MLRLADGVLPKWIFEKRLHAVEVSEQGGPQEVELGAWKATITFGTGRGFGPPQVSKPKTDTTTTPKPGSRVVIAQLGENEFVVMGAQCRVAVQPNGGNKGKPWQFLKVEEGNYEDGMFKLLRLRNGDEVGWGTVSIGEEPVLLRFTMTSW
jgi:hypothetical protein